MSTKPESTSATAASSREQAHLSFAKALSTAFKEEQEKENETSTESSKPPDNKSVVQPPSPQGTLRLSIEGAQKLIQEFSQSMETSQNDVEVRATLLGLFRGEISSLFANPQQLLVPLGTVVDHDLLRRVLLVSETSLDVDEKQLKLLCSQIYLRAVMLAPWHSLPPKLCIIKKKLVATAMSEARSRACARDPESIRLIINEVLCANEEPEYPFHDAVQRADPLDPNYKEFGLKMPGSFSTLNIRKPNLFWFFLELIKVYMVKAFDEQGYFRTEGLPIRDVSCDVDSVLLIADPPSAEHRSGTPPSSSQSLSPKIVIHCHSPLRSELFPFSFSCYNEGYIVPRSASLLTLSNNSSSRSLQRGPLIHSPPAPSPHIHHC